jgi:hypothetical protein
MASQHQHFITGTRLSFSRWLFIFSFTHAR